MEDLSKNNEKCQLLDQSIEPWLAEEQNMLYFDFTEKSFEKYGVKSKTVEKSKQIKKSSKDF